MTLTWGSVLLVPHNVLRARCERRKCLVTTTTSDYGVGRTPRPICWVWIADDAESERPDEGRAFAEAKRSVEAAIETLDKTEYLQERGQAKIVLAEVLAGDGRMRQGQNAALEALALFEEKGDGRIRRKGAKADRGTRGRRACIGDMASLPRSQGVVDGRILVSGTARSPAVHWRTALPCPFWWANLWASRASAVGVGGGLLDHPQKKGVRTSASEVAGTIARAPSGGSALATAGLRGKSSRVGGCSGADTEAS